MHHSEFPHGKRVGGIVSFVVGAAEGEAETGVGGPRVGVWHADFVLGAGHDGGEEVGEGGFEHVRVGVVVILVMVMVMNCKGCLQWGMDVCFYTARDTIQVWSDF